MAKPQERRIPWAHIALVAIAFLQLLATSLVAVLLYSQTALMIVQEQPVPQHSAEHRRNDQAAEKSGI